LNQTVSKHRVVSLTVESNGKQTESGSISATV